MVGHFVQLSVMSSAVFMVESAIMESVNFVALTMRAIHARTDPCSSQVFQFAKIYWREVDLVSSAHPVN